MDGTRSLADCYKFNITLSYNSTILLLVVYPKTHAQEISLNFHLNNQKKNNNQRLQVNKHIFEYWYHAAIKRTNF